MNNLAERIKRIREAKGLSQADVALKMNVSDRTVSAWENGTRNPKDILGLADALQVDVKELIAEPELSGAKNNLHKGYVLTSAGGGKARSLRLYSTNGYISLVVDGKRGDFMDLYCELDAEEKLYVIKNMLGDLGIDADF